MKKLKSDLEIVEVNDWEGANEALSKIGIAQARIDEATAKHEQIEQERKAQLDREIAPLKAEIEKHTNGLHAFAMKHREDFGKKKSRELTNGLLGFRTDNPSVKQIPKFKTDVTLTIISESDFADALIRVKEELNKDVILAMYSSGELNDDALKSFGLRIVQDEEFYVKVSENRIRKEAA